jgi:hypothetical protein
VAEVFELSDVHAALLDVSELLANAPVPLRVLDAQLADLLNNH